MSIRLGNDRHGLISIQGFQQKEVPTPLSRIHGLFKLSPQRPQLFNPKKKKKLGFFKDELCGMLKCTEFVELRAKCYAMNLESQSTLIKSE